MRKILVPCDGSENALRAARYAASLAKELPDVQLELLYVSDPVPLGLHAALSAEELARDQADKAIQMLSPARRMLDATGVRYRMRWSAGSPAEEIARHVHEAQCDAIIMGTRGLGPIASVIIGSVATKTIHLVDVPVTLVK